MIVIPARWDSRRLPGKPLVEIAGRTLLARTLDVARACDGVDVIVATDDVRIADHVEALGARCVMTDPGITSGTGRVLAAVRQLGLSLDIVVNLQGDAPFTRPNTVRALIDALDGNAMAQVVTPVVRLDWDALDALREAKAISPFSGTTCVTDPAGRALWFSKAVLPAMRRETAMRVRGEDCPVLRHIGLYAYRMAALKRFEALGPSSYEALEGLEQLRLLEAGIAIQTVEIAPSRWEMSGIDSPEDVTRAEALMARFGEPLQPCTA